MIIDTIENEERGICPYSSVSYYDDGEIKVTAHEKGVLIEVEQEKAVDSFNSNFTCSALLSWDAAEKLAGFIMRMKSSGGGR